MPISDTFTHGTHFEEKLVQALLADHAFAEQMLEVVTPEYFTLTHLRELTRQIQQYYLKYKSFPSIPLLEGIIATDCSNDITKSQAIRFLKKTQEEEFDSSDIEFVKATSLEFCRRQKLLLTMEECLDMTGEVKKFDQILARIQQAVNAGAERDMGHIYEDKLEERMLELRRKPVATPWPPINDVISGGVSAGELAIVLALTGVGKSHALVDIGAHAIMNGKTVIHFTFELSEIKIGKRYDARIANVDYDDLARHKDLVDSCIQRLPGVLRIRKYPNRKATTQTIRGYISKLKMSGINPDLIIVDYADIMQSSKSYENKRFEEEAVYEELRSLADELDVPIWTASQTNRSGMDAEVLTFKHIAECFAKASISDLFITMNRKKTGDNESLGNMYIAKSRLGPDGMKFNMTINTARSRINCMYPQSPEEQQILMAYDLALESEDDKLRKKIRQTLQSPTSQQDN